MLQYHFVRLFIALVQVTKSHNRTGLIKISWSYPSFLVPFKAYPPLFSISLHLSPVLVIHFLLFTVRRFLHSYNLFNNKLPREAPAMTAACLRALFFYIYLATICCHLPHPYYFQRSSKVLSSDVAQSVAICNSFVARI